MLRNALFTTLTAALLSSAAHAGSEGNADRDYLNFYGGYFDITQDDNSAAQVGLEYRYKDIYYGLRPAIGINVSDDEAVYGYGGFFWDIYLSDKWIFTPNVVAGAFHHGDGKDLGSAIEFRSGLELSYEFETNNRLGLAFNHISNASIGEHNPGAETLLVVYQHSIGWAPDEPQPAKQWWPQP